MIYNTYIHDVTISVWTTIPSLAFMVEDECQAQARFSRDLKSMVHALQHVLAVPQYSASWYCNLLLITPKRCLDVTAPLGNVQSSKLWQHAWLPLHMKPSRLPSDSECQDPHSIWSPLHVGCLLSPRCSSPEPERVASKSDSGKTATQTET